MEQIKTLTNKLKTGIKKLELKNKLSPILIAGASILITNASSFSTVAMEKHITKMSNENAAVVNSLNAVPILYSPGYRLGHYIFYKDSNFLTTKKMETGYSDYFMRD